MALNIHSTLLKIVTICIVNEQYEMYTEYRVISFSPSRMYNSNKNKHKSD